MGDTWWQGSYGVPPPPTQVSTQLALRKLRNSTLSAEWQTLLTHIYIYIYLLWKGEEARSQRTRPSAILAYIVGSPYLLLSSAIFTGQCACEWAKGFCQYPLGFEAIFSITEGTAWHWHYFWVLRPLWPPNCLRGLIGPQIYHQWAKLHMLPCLLRLFCSFFNLLRKKEERRRKKNQLRRN